MIEAGREPVRLRVWVDANYPVVYIEVNALLPSTCKPAGKSGATVTEQLRRTTPKSTPLISRLAGKLGCRVQIARFLQYDDRRRLPGSKIQSLIVSPLQRTYGIKLPDVFAPLPQGHTLPVVGPG